MKILIILTLMIGCAEPRSPAAKVFYDSADVLLKSEVYKELIKSHQDEHGFIESERCDSLLFSSLLAISGVDVDVEAAKEAPGKWRRRPSKDCFEKLESRSETSADMYLGLMYWIYFNKRADLLSEIVVYGKEHDWLMGDGEGEALIRGWISPTFRRTIADMQISFGLEADPLMQVYPVVFGSGIDGYQAHLQILHILLRGVMNNEISATEQERIEEHFRRSPTNPLFSLVYHLYYSGNQQHTIDILMNPSLFPADRLPTSSDRCASWLPERDNREYSPCPDENKQHTGGDFIFIADLLERQTQWLITR